MYNVQDYSVFHNILFTRL